MGLPFLLSSKIFLYLVRNFYRKAPLVLMLEITGRCNLSCKGCGRIRELSGMEMSLEECLSSIEECPAPVVAITGGEPLLHPKILELLGSILGRRFVYLCTNGLLLKDFLPRMKPSPYLFLSIHMDGLEETHDTLCGRKGVFKEVISSIKEAKNRGFKVCINTTVYKESDPEEVIGLLSLLRSLGVDGFLLSSPYPSTDEDVFPSLKDIEEKFKEISGRLKGFNLFNTSLYLEFLKGERELSCSPWGNPTRNPKGWKSPCYFIEDAYYGSFGELMEKTPWEKYGPGKDKRCSLCRTHYGFEPSAVKELMKPWEALRYLIK